MNANKIRLMLGVFFLLCSCSVPAAVMTVVPTATALPPVLPDPVIEEAPIVTAGPDDFAAGVNPLTGLTPADPALLERRPLAVKISNDPRPMRPQWGLTAADIVYEYYTEWGKSRFIAVFYGRDAEMAGPIRSARFFDEQVVRMYKAALAYVGADERVLKHFKNQDYVNRLISEFPAGCPPICRVDPKMWNHAVTDTRLLSKHIQRLGVSNHRPDLTGMRFDSRIPENGQPVESITVRFSPFTYGTWVYDYRGGTYLRLQDNQDDVEAMGEGYDILNDRLTGEIVDADNVVVVFARYEYVVKKDDAEVVSVNLIGSGSAVLHRNGLAYPLTWIRKNKESLLTLVDANGMAAPFKPGRTWFEVIGETSRRETDAPGAERYLFAIP